MSENLFFDLGSLKSLGKNVIIGKTVRIRYPELVEIGDNCIIDDFTYISTGLRLLSYVHIAAGCKLIGGRKCTVEMGRFSTLAPNVVISAGTDDYRSGIATPFVPERFKGNMVYGDIRIGQHCIVGSGTVVLPKVVFEDGAAVGALSLVKGNLAGWQLYGGVPAKPLGKRNRGEILEAEKRWMEETHGD